MSISETKLLKIASTKQAIKQAIEAKNLDVGEIPFDEYPSKIELFEPYVPITEEWTPDPLWWDIKTILQNDTEPYPTKIIELYNDSSLATDMATTFYANIVAVKFSDSPILYTEPVTHIWDTSQDKIASDGKTKTRYTIFYFNNQIITKIPWINAIYTVYSNCSLNINDIRSVESFDFINGANMLSTKTDYTYFCKNNKRLKRLPAELNLSNGTNFTEFCFGCINLRSLPNSLDFSKGTNFTYFLSSSGIIKLPDNLNTGLGTNFSQFCSNCKFLRLLPENLNVGNGITFTSFLSDSNILKLPENLDVSKGTNFSSFLNNTLISKLPDNLNTGLGTNFSQFCNACFYLKSLPENLNVGNGTNFTNFLSNNNILKLPENLDVSKGTNFSNFMQSNSYYYYVKFTSVNTSLVLINSMSIEVLLGIINCLNNRVGFSTLTLTLGATNLAKLTVEQKAVATSKNWTLA